MSKKEGQSKSPQELKITGRVGIGYQVNSDFLQEPEDGWRLTSAKTPHSKFLVAQYKAGVSTKQVPTWLNQQFATLRCVKYGKPFRDFKSDCVAAYKKVLQANKQGTYREAPSSGDE